MCALPLNSNVRNVKCNNSWHSSYDYRQFYVHSDRQVGNTVNTAARFILLSRYYMVVEKHFFVQKQNPNLLHCISTQKYNIAYCVVK